MQSAVPLATAALLSVAVAGCSTGAGPVPTASRPSSAAPARTPSSAASSAAPGAVQSGSVPVPGRPVTIPALPAGMRPSRLLVAAIGLDVPLISLGIATDGSLQVPKSYQQVGWLRTSPAPGQRGPAILAGHVDSTSGPAPFYRLRDLRQGDRIIVVRGNGSRVSFTVDAVQRYAKSAFPTATVYGPVPGPALRLLTCGGQFDRTTHHYRDNIVVYAS